LEKRYLCNSRDIGQTPYLNPLVTIGTFSTMADSGSDGDRNSDSASWFRPIQSFLATSMDEQRVERLQQCRILEDVAAECRRKSKKQRKKDRLHLEDLPAGIRMVRYFDWRNVHEYDTKCIREEHAVWACRAIALQCGSELVELRSCFNDLQTPLEDTPYVKNYGAVLGCSHTAYETKEKEFKKKDASREIPCRAFQEQLGRCVAKNATALGERESARAAEAQK
jgi:hypothetical protein